MLCTVQKRARILVSPRAVAAFRAAFDVDATGRPRIESKQVSEPWRAAMLELCANAVTAVAAADKESALYWIVGECVKKVNLLFRAAGVGTIKRATLLGTGKGAQKLAAKHAATAAEAEARALSEEANEKTLELEERLVSAFTLDELREAACLILDKENEEGEASEGSLLMAEKADLGWLHEQAEREELLVSAVELTLPETRAQQKLMLQRSHAWRSRAQAGCPTAPWMTAYRTNHGAVSNEALRKASTLPIRVNTSTGELQPSLAQVATQRCKTGSNALPNVRRKALTQVMRLSENSGVSSAMLLCTLQQGGCFAFSPSGPVQPAVAKLLLQQADAQLAAAAASSTAARTKRKRKCPGVTVWRAQRTASSRVRVNQDRSASNKLVRKALPAVTVNKATGQELKRLQGLLQEKGKECARLAAENARLTARVQHNQRDTELGRSIRTRCAAEAGP